MSDEQPAADVVDAATSPLWMVSQAPALNQLVVALQQHRKNVDSGGTSTTSRLAFSRAQVARARAEFSDMIRHGERDLHQLAGLLAEHFLGTVRRRSVVIGEIRPLRGRIIMIIQSLGEAPSD